MTSEATKRARASKRRGASFETDLLKGLRGEGLEVERLTKTGKDDEGDLVVSDEWGKVILEAKNEAKIDLPRYIREAMLEADNYAKHRNLPRQEITAAAIVKARGKSWKDAYVVLSAREFFDLGDDR